MFRYLSKFSAIVQSHNFEHMLSETSSRFEKTGWGDYENKGAHPCALCSEHRSSLAGPNCAFDDPASECESDPRTSAMP